MLMDHKCEGCQYKGYHQEMMFKPMAVCNRGANLLEAIKNYEAEKCPYQKTNADRIRAMSDEELANLIADTPICKEKWRKCLENGCDCEPCLLEWLQKEVEK